FFSFGTHSDINACAAAHLHTDPFEYSKTHDGLAPDRDEDMAPSSNSHRLWDPNHPVLRILRERRESGSTPGHRTDSAKRGLAVEGGGMRGVISGAMLSQLEDSGFTNAFDAVYGCSSGAINAAYFLTGQTWYPLSIYYDDLTTKKFVNFSAPLRGRPILALD